MPRRVANALTLLSAVVCVGSLLLLVGRSFFLADTATVRIATTGAGAAVFTGDGHLGLACGPFARNFGHHSRSVSGWRQAYQATWTGVSGIKWLGIGWVMGPRGALLILPLWLLPLLTTIPPVRWWRARRRGVGRGFAVMSAGDASPVGSEG